MRTRFLCSLFLFVGLSGGLTVPVEAIAQTTDRNAPTIQHDVKPSADELKQPDNAFEGKPRVATDRTREVLEELEASGLRNLGRFEIGKNPQTQIAFHLAITPQAEAIIQQKKFDLRDDNFDLAAFTKELAKVFTDNVQYFQEVVPECQVKELHFILHDLEEDRKLTINRTKRNSSVILGDIRRWHKLYHGQSSYKAYTTSIHEFTHVANYRFDPKEVKLHLELTAIIFELMSYYRIGEDSLESYLRTSTVPLSNLREILNPDYTGCAPLRYIAAFFFSKVLDGTYPTIDEPDKAIENFARLYLSNSQVGNAGFDAACREANITAADGSALTLQLIRTELYAALVAKSNAS